MQRSFTLKFLFCFIGRLDSIIPDVEVNGLQQATLPGLFAHPDPYVASRMNPLVAIYKYDAVEHLNLYILAPKINKNLRKIFTNFLVKSHSLYFHEFLQEKRATLNSTDTLGLVSEGQFLLLKDVCGLAKNFAPEVNW